MTDINIEQLATLARLSIDAADQQDVEQRISNILDLVGQLSLADTTKCEPMAHPMDAVQELRADEVTESDQRERFQALAPAAENGLYLVPKVIG